jgi:hypothetical protein
MDLQTRPRRQLAALSYSADLTPETDAPPRARKIISGLAVGVTERVMVRAASSCCSAAASNHRTITA